MPLPKEEEVKNNEHIPCFRPPLVLVLVQALVFVLVLVLDYCDSVLALVLVPQYHPLTLSQPLTIFVLLFLHPSLLVSPLLLLCSSLSPLLPSLLLAHLSPRYSHPLCPLLSLALYPDPQHPQSNSQSNPPLVSQSNLPLLCLSTFCWNGRRGE